jgi:hypothetical protein
MTLTFTIKPEIATALEVEAKRAGQSVQEYAAELFAEAIEDVLDAAEADCIMANTDPSEWRSLDELRAAIYEKRAKAA